jgi:hypothetical protein
VNHVAPKAKSGPQKNLEQGRKNESVQNSNDGVLYGAHGRNTRTKRKGGRLDQENRDHV